MSKVLAWIDLDDPEEEVEGHYWAGPNGGALKLTPTAEACPFCSSALSLVSAPIFGRIGQEQGKRTERHAPALVELMPATHEALICSNEECQTVFTRVKP